jgi:hypothetical protein
MLSIEEVNKLQQENEIISKRYNSLLKKYNEVLGLAKQNADSNEYCIQDLEKKFEKLKELLTKFDNLIENESRCYQTVDDDENGRCYEEIETLSEDGFRELQRLTDEFGDILCGE